MVFSTRLSVSLKITELSSKWLHCQEIDFLLHSLEEAVNHGLLDIFRNIIKFPGLEHKCLPAQSTLRDSLKSSYYYHPGSNFPSFWMGWSQHLVSDRTWSGLSWERTRTSRFYPNSQNCLIGTPNTYCLSQRPSSSFSNLGEIERQEKLISPKPPIIKLSMEQMLHND